MAASTSAAPARRSGAEILAPVYLDTPSMIAVLPSTLMLGAHTGQLIHIFETVLENTLRHDALVPLESPSATVIWGCISVGNPG